MRILIVQDTDWIRRNPIQHTHLAERMVKRGHEVRVIDYEILWREEGKRELVSRREVRSATKVIAGAEVTVVRPPILKLPVLDYVSMLRSYSREIERQLDEFAPDVVISNDILSTWLAYRAAGKRGIPTVYYIIDVEYKLVPYRFLQPLGRVMEARNISRADLVIAINEGLRDYAIAMGAASERTRVLRAGIDPEKYHPRLTGRRVRERYGLKEDDTVLFFMGWVYPFSGLKELVNRLGKNGNRDLKLVIVGDGDGLPALKKAVSANGARRHVVLAGRQPYEAIPEFVAAADICLLPAHNNKVMRDIVPIKMYEYLAMQKPVISTRLPGVMREFGDANGVVYVNRPEDVLEEALRLKERGLMTWLGLKGRAFAMRYSWENITDQFEITLKKLIEEKSA